PRRSPLPCTAPAEVIAAACSASASVSVDLPASGWEITANVRRRAASAAASVDPLFAASFAAVLTGGRLPVLIALHRPRESTPLYPWSQPSGRSASRTLSSTSEVSAPLG